MKHIFIMQLVDIPDSNLRAAIAGEVEKSGVNDLTKLTELNLQNAGINKLDGLEGAKNLVTLRAGYNSISDLSPLKELIKSEKFSIFGAIRGRPFTSVKD